jgi:hypothetical protein
LRHLEWQSALAFILCAFRNIVLNPHAYIVRTDNYSCKVRLWQT